MSSTLGSLVRSHRMHSAQKNKKNMQQHINWYALDATIYKYLYTHSKAAAQMIQQYNRQGIEVLAYRGSSIAYNVTIDIVYVSEIHFLDGIWYIILYT